MPTQAPTQAQMFYRAVSKLAECDKLFLDLVADGLTREELARNIERRPWLWSRYEGWLDKLPTKGDDQ